jgi:bacterioferritin
VDKDEAMKGDAKVIDALNDVLTGELTAINQYFLHARMCKDWGYDRIADKVRHESIDEMKHAEKLMDRILFLEGMPNVQRLMKINIGENVKEQFESDLKLEYDAVDRLRKAIQTAVDARDHTSRELFEHILEDEEKHIDWLETQLNLIQELTLVNYLAQQLREDS